MFTSRVQPNLLGALALAALLGACAPKNSTAPSSSDAAAAAAPSTPATLLPAPKPRLAPLAFLTGSWVCVNPNKSVNREVWSSPAGGAVTGAFHQLRRDASPGFYELSTIVVEGDSVVLYHRHLHAKLELDPRRASQDTFILISIEPGKAVFKPSEGSPGASEEGIETMTYRLESPDVLLQELVFKPGSKEKGFTSRYVRE